MPGSTVFFAVIHQNMCCVRCTVLLIVHYVNLSSLSDAHCLYFVVCDVFCLSVWQILVLLCICYVTRFGVGLVLGFWCGRFGV